MRLIFALIILSLSQTIYSKSKDVPAANQDKCVLQKDFKACMTKLQDYAHVDDMKQFRNLWNAVCADATFNVTCREESAASEGATAKMKATKRRESVLQVSESVDKVVLFFIAPNLPK